YSHSVARKGRAPKQKPTTRPEPGFACLSSLVFPGIVVYLGSDGEFSPRVCFCVSGSVLCLSDKTNSWPKASLLTGADQPASDFRQGLQRRSLLAPWSSRPPLVVT